jgi:hypothetical protein
MYYVQCPRCGSVVEIPADAVGKDRTDPWNIIECDDCDLAFDFDDEEVKHEPDSLDRV